MRKNDYCAPLDSVAYLALLRVCRSQGIDTDKVNDLLWVINVEPTLTGFLRIVDNLSKVIEEARAQRVISQHSIDRLAPWLTQMTQLLGYASLLVDECGEQLVAGQKGRNMQDHPLAWICLERNALYSLLWNRADEKGLRERLNHEGFEYDRIDEITKRFVVNFRLLQWHLFYTHSSLMQEHTCVDDYLSHSGHSPLLGKHNKSLYNSCHSARDYGSGEMWQKLDKLNLRTTSEDFFKRLSDALAEELDKTARPFKTLGTKWFRHTDRLREGSHGSRRCRRRRKSTAYHVEYGNNMRISRPNPGDDGPKVRIISQWDNNKEWKEADLSEDEIGPEDEEQVLVNFACTARGTHRDQIMVAIGFAHRRAVINQHLPIHYEYMTLGEVGTAMRTLGDAVRDPKIGIQYRKAAAVGILMYWTGSDLKRIRQLVVVPVGAEVADDVELAYFLEDNTWRISVPIYKAKRKPLDGMDALCRPGGEHLYLPDLWHVDSIIKMVSGDSEQGEDRRVYKPFSRHNLSTYRKALNSIFETHLTKKGMRITPVRLGNDLFLRLLSCDDPVNAMLITGKMHSSVATARHYSTPSVNCLATLYREVAVKLVGKIRQENYQDRPDMPSLPLLPEAVLSRPNLGVGAEYCPSISEVKLLLQRVREALGHDNSPLEYNNLYSIYTALVIGYCTGYRAVRNIRLDPSRRDPVGQWAWISDKNDEKGYHTRRIWLAPVLEQHLQAYEAHRRVVFATWGSHYPTIPRPEEMDLPYLFLVDGSKRKVQPICSAMMAQPLAALDYPLPLNANRKFLRTELSERRCPIDVLNSFMGHWALGQEPHGPYSCLSPRHERRQLEKYLLPLLQEIGVQVMTSRWVRN